MKQESSPSVPGLRLNKAIAHSGLASRRAADSLILEGRVSVNGVTVREPGTRIDPQKDSLSIDGTVVPLGQKAEYTYVLCNKPVHVISSAKDPQGRKTVLDMLPDFFSHKRLYPVGRLDYFSEGLLLLTDDGELTLRLTHPRYHLPKTYQVKLREKPSIEALETMRKGMTLTEGEKLAPVAVKLLPGSENELEMTLNQGINRQIRRMCRDLDLTILRLVRIASGPLCLGNLPPGEVRELSEKERKALYTAVGL